MVDLPNEKFYGDLHGTYSPLRWPVYQFDENLQKNVYKTQLEGFIKKDRNKGIQAERDIIRIKADMLTMVLSKEKFCYFRQLFDICNFE